MAGRKLSEIVIASGRSPAVPAGWMTKVFEGFTLRRIDVGEAVLRVRIGGAGPPILLLHGHPRTHTTWHRVAPLLATDHTVVCPDLRGYGESSKPGDYRAGLEVDRQHDDEDRANGRKISCPVLALWAAKDDLGELCENLDAVWAEWADDVQIRSIDCGHHMAEDAAVELVRELRTLL